MNTDAGTKKDEKPLFGLILSRLGNELIEMDRHSNEILEKVCLFKNIKEPPQGGKNAEKPQEIIAEFEYLIDRMSVYNDILSQVQKGLAELVG